MMIRVVALSTMLLHLSEGARNNLDVDFDEEPVEVEEPQVSLAEVEEPQVSLAEVAEPQGSLAEVEEPQVSLANVEEPQVSLGEVEEPQVSLAEVEEPQVSVAEVEEPQVSLAEIDANTRPRCHSDSLESYPFLEDIGARRDTLFYVYGEPMANSGDHQFMVWRTHRGGSSTYGTRKNGNWHGLDYWFAKGPRCASPTSSHCVSAFSSNHRAGSNLPSSWSSAMVLPPGWSTTDQFEVSSMHLNFRIVSRNGRVMAKARSHGRDCYVERVHICESNGRSGMNFSPTVYDIIGKTANGRTCYV